MGWRIVLSAIGQLYHDSETWARATSQHRQGVSKESETMRMRVHCKSQLRVDEVQVGRARRYVCELSLEL